MNKYSFQEKKYGYILLFKKYEYVLLYMKKLGVYTLLHMHTRNKADTRGLS